MRRLLLVTLLAGGCGAAESEVSSMQLSLGSSGLMASDVQSVQVLVLGGPQATCDHALQPHSPLDDPELTVVRHALFTFDGTARKLTGIPADQPLAFYVDAFATPDGRRPRVGRGCSENTLEEGKSTGVSITLEAAPDD
jgi:hypothetical protein